MAARVIDVKTYTAKRLDVFFFDNNIWMYLFCPLGEYNKSRQKQYSELLKSVKTANSTIFTSSLILPDGAKQASYRKQNIRKIMLVLSDIRIQW